MRGTYVATGKLTAKLSAGVEVREFEGSDTVKTNPVFSLGWHISRSMEPTSISWVIGT